jgi:hypothetical protein
MPSDIVNWVREHGFTAQEAVDILMEPHSAQRDSTENEQEVDFVEA